MTKVLITALITVAEMMASEGMEEMVEMMVSEGTVVTGKL